jgi:hypothetical protein
MAVTVVWTCMHDSGEEGTSRIVIIILKWVSGKQTHSKQLRIKLHGEH